MMICVSSTWQRQISPLGGAKKICSASKMTPPLLDSAWSTHSEIIAGQSGERWCNWQFIMYRAKPQANFIVVRISSPITLAPYSTRVYVIKFEPTWESERVWVCGARHFTFSRLFSQPWPSVCVLEIIKRLSWLRNSFLVQNYFSMMNMCMVLVINSDWSNGCVTCDRPLPVAVTQRRKLKTHVVTFKSDLCCWLVINILSSNLLIQTPSSIKIILVLWCL